jgi:hypothetical protein
MSQPVKKNDRDESEPVRVLGRGLRAKRGVRMTLRTIREATDTTQVGLAQRSQIDQADISRLENRPDFDDCQVATLKRYVEALGGQLELVAKFGDKIITLAGANSESKK